MDKYDSGDDIGLMLRCVDDSVVTNKNELGDMIESINGVLSIYGFKVGGYNEWQNFKKMIQNRVTRKIISEIDLKCESKSNES